MLYDDGGIACNETNLIIRRYYLWGAKTLPYTTPDDPETVNRILVAHLTR